MRRIHVDEYSSVLRLFVLIVLTSASHLSRQWLGGLLRESLQLTNGESQSIDSTSKVGAVYGFTSRGIARCTLLRSRLCRAGQGLNRWETRAQPIPTFISLTKSRTVIMLGQRRELDPESRGYKEYRRRASEVHSDLYAPAAAERSCVRKGRQKPDLREARVFPVAAERCSGGNGRLGWLGTLIIRGTSVNLFLTGTNG